VPAPPEPVDAELRQRLSKAWAEALERKGSAGPE
jgi:hypothetical protein